MSEAQLMRVMKPASDDVSAVIARCGFGTIAVSRRNFIVSVADRHHPVIDKALTLAMMAGADLINTSDTWRWKLGGMQGSARDNIERAAIDFCLSFGLEFEEESPHT